MGAGRAGSLKQTVKRRACGAFFFSPSGRCRKFTASDSDLALVGWDGKASSIKFVGSFAGGNYVATLYDLYDFGGDSTRFTASDADLGDNPIKRSRASSIEIDCVGDGVCLYEYPNYNAMGWARMFTASDSNLSLSVSSRPKFPPSPAWFRLDGYQLASGETFPPSPPVPLRKVAVTELPAICVDSTFRLASPPLPPAPPHVVKSNL